MSCFAGAKIQSSSDYVIRELQGTSKEEGGGEALRRAADQAEDVEAMKLMTTRTAVP